MKKIFAIALALVMVLSMASAFATYCNWGAWDCDSTTIRCGKATIEVVPYVRANTACGFEFAANNCAAAVVKENVYFAVKLTVDADVSKEWYEAATLSFKGTDVDTNGWTVNASLPAYADVKNGGVWYLEQNAAVDATQFNTSTAGWVKENSDFTFGAKNVFKAVAEKSSAKVCATLKSVWAIGTAKDAQFTWEEGWKGDMTIGSYDFGFRATAGKSIKVDKGDKELWIVLDKDSKVDYVWVRLSDATTQYKLNGRNPAGEFTGVVSDAKGSDVNGTAVALGTSCNEGAFVKEVFDFLKIDFGTCMTDQGVSNNFGWNDEIKSCTAYKTQGSVAVDADCVVAIPKTGDASVLAWLF